MHPLHLGLPNPFLTNARDLANFCCKLCKILAFHFFMSARAPFEVVRNAILSDNGFIIEHYPQVKLLVGSSLSFVGKHELYGHVVVHDPSPIQFAAIHAKPVALCALLEAGIKAGLPVTSLLDPQHSNTKLNALTLCVLSNETTALQCLERLINFLAEKHKQGVKDVPDVNFGGIRERSPLAEAVYHNRPEFVKLLIDRGACPVIGKGSMPVPLVVAAVRVQGTEDDPSDPARKIWSIMIDYVGKHKDDKVLDDCTLSDLLQKARVWDAETKLYDPDNDGAVFGDLLGPYQRNELLSKLGTVKPAVADVQPVQPQHVTPAPKSSEPTPSEQAKCAICESTDPLTLTLCPHCNQSFCTDHWEDDAHTCPRD